MFTDPPFGSNIFYSDMNLFQEAWLGNFTDHEKEAVVDRSGNGTSRARLSDTNSSSPTRSRSPIGFSSPAAGCRWSSRTPVARCGRLFSAPIHAAGFMLEDVAILNKGQRSVKGLASGFENVVTVDLILSMRKAWTAKQTRSRQHLKARCNRSRRRSRRRQSADAQPRLPRGHPRLPQSRLGCLRTGHPRHRGRSSEPRLRDRRAQRPSPEGQTRRWTPSARSPSQRTDRAPGPRSPALRA